jgi:DNA-binding transcriptional LysR family regulator
MDLRRLSYFVTACQAQSFAAAAADLDITQSTLSGALKTLSEEFGAPLFEQVQRRLHPTSAGIWLYRSALLMLHAEEFARNWIANGPDDQSSHHLVVDIRASFVLGRLAKAVSRGIQAFGKDHPDTFVQPCFSGMGQSPGQARSIAGSLGAGRRSLLIIEARPYDPARAPEASDEVTILARDVWVVMQGGRPAPNDRPVLSIPFTIPSLDASLIEQAIDATGGRGAAAIETSDEPATMLPRMIWQQPNHPFLIPRALAADRPGLLVRPFEPQISCELIARHEPDDDSSRTLASIIAAGLGEPEQNVIFRPLLSHRQMRYSRALFEFGSITAAARSLSMAQPALSEILQKLEQALGCQFFNRSRDGLVPTSAGLRLGSGSQVMIEAVRRITVQSASVAGANGGRMKIGVAPSEGRSSVTAQCIARAIGVWRLRFPSIKLQVVQASASELQNLVASGSIGLAITERTAPGMARFKLAEHEPLSVIANPRFNLLPPGPIRLAELIHLPLIVPTTNYGVRQILDAALMDAHLRFVPALEINAMAIVLAMLQEQPFCSLAPASAVQNQIAKGQLRSHAIIDPALTRQFYAFHSGQRELSDPEREFLRALRQQFTSAEETRVGHPSKAEPLGAIAERA